MFIHVFLAGSSYVCYTLATILPFCIAARLEPGIRTMKRYRRSILILYLFTFCVSACARKADLMTSSLPPEQQFAVQFAHTLAQHDYKGAHSLTTQEYQRQVSVAEIQNHFEQVIPADWGPVDPILAVGDTFTDFPDKQASDIGWVYVSLEGTVYPYSEGLYILMAQENNALRVRDDCWSTTVEDRTAGQDQIRQRR
jgi:hypothetical protein